MVQGIMIQGTASNVGKSILATALCRMLAQDGYQVAPFKSWNMALNSYVTPQGGEIGCAQAIQADAAGINPTVKMQPLLVKPKGKGQSQVIVRGEPYGDFGLERKSSKYINWALEIISDSLQDLAREYEVIVLEGAGSPAEINIKDQDLANMKVAKLNQTPVLLVADIDRGGALASVVGTLKLLEPEERELVQGIILNKFRGDFDLLKPGIEILEEKVGKPVVGVIPYLRDFRLPEEDNVSLASFTKQEAEVKIGIIKLPHISNFTDFDALALEPQVALKYLERNDQLSGFDTIIIPGTKNTTADLEYLKETGLAEKIIELAEKGVSIIGICGGYQMLGNKLLDSELTEGDKRVSRGLGLLDIETEFSPAKSTYQVSAEIKSKQNFFSNLVGQQVTGYEIHMGQTSLGDQVEPIFRINYRSDQQVEINDGACNKEGTIWGTYLHGLFANDQFRREFINNLRSQKGLAKLDEDYSSSSEELKKNYNRLAEVVRENLDLELFYEILEGGEIRMVRK
ncbi:cobyric acid synthase CobQ [Halobacteroides halobius DSM 5150]|uniref:Cobyric acid synthase n=1 Tax=Halobacteroides halobius (strain ATCC 35273 / DSM 5150 / MD-1) TaxID=748449 RepID=L0KC28_HALHC|nr:cobyric acid synthase [Halobacteroides halobius]AGB41643.1 cobyric acid synthase CobQ [Halobacteroides halobius DSM 5150]